MENAIAVGTRFMQEVNSAATLAELRSARRISVSALAKRTGLSRQAVTRSLGLLEADGYVEISEPDRTVARSGRPPQMVRFRSELGYVMGVDVNPREVRVLVADLLGEPAGEARRALSRKEGSIEDVLRRTVVDALADASITAAKLWHVSIGVPGIVDIETGNVTLSPNLPASEGRGLVSTVQQIVPCAVALDNDVKLATRGERWRSTPRTEDSLVFIDWSERLGAGIVLHGEIYRGASNDSGDLGYLDLLVEQDAHVDRDGPLGRFERWIGTRELVRLAQAKSPAGVTVNDVDEVAAAVVRGEPWAYESLEVIATRFARGVAAIRALLDPEVIIVGGAMTVFGESLLDTLRHALESEPLNQPRLELSHLGSDAIVQGAIYDSLTAIERARFAPTAIRTA